MHYLKTFIHLWRRALQHITIRKQEEESHMAVEAGAPDEDIGKLARISHRVSAPHTLIKPLVSQAKTCPAPPKPSQL